MIILHTLQDILQYVFNILFHIAGDGFIDKSEYTTLYTAFGIDKSTCEATFDRLAQVICVTECSACKTGLVGALTATSPPSCTRLESDAKQSNSRISGVI